MIDFFRPLISRKSVITIPLSFKIGRRELLKTSSEVHGLQITDLLDSELRDIADDLNYTDELSSSESHSESTTPIDKAFTLPCGNSFFLPSPKSFIVTY